MADTGEAAERDACGRLRPSFRRDERSPCRRRPDRSLRARARCRRTSGSSATELDGPVFADATGHTLYKWPFKQLRVGDTGDPLGRSKCTDVKTTVNSGFMSPYPPGLQLPDLDSRLSCTAGLASGARVRRRQAGWANGPSLRATTVASSGPTRGTRSTPRSSIIVPAMCSVPTPSAAGQRRCRTAGPAATRHPLGLRGIDHTGRPPAADRGSFLGLHVRPRRGRQVQLR